MEPDSEDHATSDATVMLVDDEEVIRDMTKEMLKDAGYGVHICNGGAEAISYFQKNAAEIDLVILDLIMPGMGGREVYSKLREVDPGVAVLLSSGHSINGEAQEILNEGVRGFIQKPFRYREIIKAIEDTLDS